MVTINKLFGAVMFGAVLGASHTNAMCTATVTNVPVQLPYDRTTSVFKTGETIWHITQRTVIDGNNYVCAWMGGCYSTDSVKLAHKLKVVGEIGKMSGVEIRANSIEADAVCYLDDLYYYEHK